MTRKKSKAKAKGTGDTSLPAEGTPLPPDSNTLPGATSRSEVDVTAAQAQVEGSALSQRGKWSEARDAYMKGINLSEGDPKLQKTILLGLVAANLELGNWEDVLRDTAEILRMDPNSIKALHRTARALNELSRYDEALVFCTRGLRLDSRNQPLQKEQHVAKLGDYGKLRHQLMEAYTYHRLRIVPTSRVNAFGALPTTHPHEMPYLDPPIQSNPLTATLYSYIRFLYIERHATDTVSNYPSDKPILSLLDTFLPGTTAFPTPSKTRDNLTLVPDDEDDPHINHPTNWDPHYDYLPSKLLVYALTAGGDTILIQGGMTLSDVFEQVRTMASTHPNPDYVFLELKRGMMHFFVFPRGSEAESKWNEGDFEDPMFLGDPRFQLSSRIDSAMGMKTRHFSYDNGEAAQARGTNFMTSSSWSAREQILRYMYSKQDEQDSSSDE